MSVIGMNFSKGKIKLSLCLTNSAVHHEGVWGSACTDLLFYTSALARGEWSASRPDRLTPGGRAPGTHWIGDWADTIDDLDNAEKRQFLTVPEHELRPLGRPARRQSLYRLRYSGILASFKILTDR
jgi:hypothetical protein